MSTVEKQKNGTMYGVEPYKETKGEEYMGAHGVINRPTPSTFTHNTTSTYMEVWTSLPTHVTSTNRSGRCYCCFLD